MMQYATGDQKLNEQIFGNLILKPLDFSSPEIYKLFKTKRPTSKKEIYLHQLEKLNVLISYYKRDDFEKIKFHALNVDQILTFIQNPNFIRGQAKKEKVVEALHFLHKSRELKIYSDRPEIINLV